MAKKNPGRFTIQFNLTFERDLQAIKVLQSVSARGKATLIREALLLLNERDHYCDVSDVTDVIEMIKNMPEQATPASKPKPKDKEIIKEEFDDKDEFDINDGIVELEYDDDDDDDSDDEGDEFDDVLASSLASMMQ